MTDEHMIQLTKGVTSGSLSAHSKVKILVDEVVFDHVDLETGNRLRVLGELSAQVAKNEFICILGPSGRASPKLEERCARVS